MNPCPVYERNSKTLFLFFITVPVGVSEHKQIHKNKNQARLCYITSKDIGKTWSHITDLTADVIGEQVKDWATFAVGPGHGVQMKSGRLIIPAYVYPCHSLNCKPTSHAFAFYSDDKGSTWHAGKRMYGESCECQMAEIIDDEGNSTLYCNARSTSGHRVEAVSESNGEAFEKPSSAHKLTETGHGCQGSVFSFAPDQAPEKTWLLYCHPTNPSKRTCLGVYLNKTPWDASGWEDSKLIIHDGPSGYSDLAQCGDGKHFACLMECGEITRFSNDGEGRGQGSTLTAVRAFISAMKRFNIKAVQRTTTKQIFPKGFTPDTAHTIHKGFTLDTAYTIHKGFTPIAVVSQPAQAAVTLSLHAPASPGVLSCLHANYWNEKQVRIDEALSQAAIGAQRHNEQFAEKRKLIIAVWTNKNAHFVVLMSLL
ncbi:Sialidase-3 [Anabarilius grahami]|uniref:exo-alpha-sialidase n=1 Tax=Anabarilius grahami TaxID=495550 RepID=A0A3N0YMZ9_ANAGA|nr:Sialidase-3 [Anabarilius grahami]